jgi:hypothetical protein
MKNTISKISLQIIIIVSTCISCNFAPGSYPYAEEYNLKIKKSELITKIEQFKKNNSDYCVPEQVMLIDGQSEDKDDHWYHVYFYFKDQNVIIYTWLRRIDNENTLFAFVGINEGLVLGHWKYINKDFSLKENAIYKEKFKQRILNQLVN